MRHRAAVLLVTSAVALLAGCSGEPVVGDLPSADVIFDRAQQPADLLPADLAAPYDGDSTRYVGEDSAGDRYWAVKDLSDTACIVYLPVDDPKEYLGFCGGPGLSGETAAGIVMEHASSPSQLDPDSAELVGDTLLVKRP